MRPHERASYDRALGLGKAAPSEGDTIRAWERFLTGEPDAATPLAQIVIASWQRSLSLGVNPASRAAPLAAQGDRFFALRHRNRDLIIAAADIFRRLGGLLAESRCMMLLTDPFGIVLETAGDPRTLGDGEAIHLGAGGQWDEATIGTNGIGTALATGRAAQVHGPEHFCEGIKGWTCAAAPIRAPGSGKILGIVDISGPPTTYQRGNLALAVAAARQIETALAAHATHERARLLERCLQAMPSLGAGDMLAIDRAGRLVFTNHPPDRLPDLPGFGPDESIQDWAARLPEALREALRVDTVQLEGRIIGALVTRAPAPSARPATPVNGAFASIIGASDAMRQMVERAQQLAARRVPLLIQGETGTGKEVLVRAIHQAAGPASPLVLFNCGAATKELLGGDLFGHVRGAFTGATQEGRAGRFELAHGGILCLDEVGELPLDMQPMLLRVLEEGVVYRLGDTTPRKIDVRVIAMTNRDLRREAAAGRFRADLFYRLNVAGIEIPPLRARAGDVELLLAHFLETLSARHGVSPRSVSSAARAALHAYSWPGNVRELRNLVEGLLLTGAGPIECQELVPEIRETSPAADNIRLDEIGRMAMRRAIEAAGGNVSEAARKLGISRSTLHRRLREG